MKKKYKKTICLDIDNTICKTFKNNYQASKPNINAIKKLIIYSTKDISLYFLPQDLWEEIMKILHNQKTRF